MPPSKTVCYSRKRPVPCIPKCHRRYYFTILIFKHFFDELRKYVFGQELPNKPRTYKVTTCLTAALLGWLQICDKVLRVWHLQRPWICVSWSRRHYDKLTLPFFSDTEYQSVFTRLLVKTVGVWLCLQKKVELFLYFTRNTTEHDDAKSLSQIAKLSASCEFLSTFKECLLTVYHRCLWQQPVNLSRLLTSFSDSWTLRTRLMPQWSLQQQHWICTSSVQNKNNPLGN